MRLEMEQEEGKVYSATILVNTVNFLKRWSKL